MHVGVVKARHDELIVEMNCLDTFSAASAVEKDVRHLADAADLVVGDGHGLGPRLRRIIGVDAAVHVVGRVWSILLRAPLRLECRDGRDHRKGEETQGEKEATRSGFHRDFSSATPEIPRTVRSVRFKPASRPAESYHSCKECAPPPLPPAPMERASMPIESGMFASVEDRSMRDTLPTNSSAARSAASSGESWGMEFTEVPPSIWPILKVVRGLAGTFVLMKRTEPRTRALMGLGMPKSDQLWPPGPVMEASSLREASALVVT